MRNSLQVLWRPAKPTRKRRATRRLLLLLIDTAALGVIALWLPHIVPGGTTKATRATACPAAITRSAIVASSLDSRILAGPHALYVYVPAGYCRDTARRYPVVYLLHGAPGAAADWLAQTGVHATVDRLIATHILPPLLVAMPDGNYGALGDTFWANGSAVAGFGQAEDYVMQEVVPTVDRQYRTLADRTARAIGGLSAGAYGAMNIAVHHPDEFSVVAAMSGFYQAGLTDGGVDLFAGDAALQRANSPLALLDSVAAVRSLALYFDVGADDPWFADDSGAFDAALTARRIPHEFHVYPGTHSWDYWRAHLGDALRFVGQHMAPTPAPLPAP